MVTREQALAASSPFLVVLLGEIVLGGLIIVGWNVWDRRIQLATLLREKARI